MNFALIIIIGITAGVHVFLRITVTEIGLCCQNYIYAVLLHPPNQIIQEVEMLIVKQIPDTVGNLHVPQMHSERIEAKTLHMVHVSVYCLFMVHPQRIQCTVRMGKRHSIVCPVIPHFVALRITHAAMAVNIGKFFLD